MLHSRAFYAVDPGGVDIGSNRLKEEFNFVSAAPERSRQRVGAPLFLSKGSAPDLRALRRRENKGGALGDPRRNT